MAEAPSDPTPTEAPAPEAPTPDKKGKPEAAAPEPAATEAPAANAATPPAAEPNTTPAEAPAATPTPAPAPVSHPKRPPQRPLRPQPPTQSTVPGPSGELRADSTPPWKPGEGPEGDTVPKAAPVEAPKAEAPSAPSTTASANDSSTAPAAQPSAAAPKPRPIKNAPKKVTKQKKAAPKPSPQPKKEEPKPDAADDDTFKPKVEGYGIPGHTGLAASTVGTNVAMAAKAAFATAYKSKSEVRARINQELADLRSRTLEVYHSVWQLRDGQNWVVPSEDAQVSLDRAVMARNAYIGRMRGYVCKVAEEQLSILMLQMLDDFKFADSKTALKSTKVLERDPYTEKQVPVVVDDNPLTMSSESLLSAKTRQVVLQTDVRKKREALSVAKSDKVRDKLSEDLRLLNRETLMLDAAIKQIEATWERAKAQLAQDITDKYPESKTYRDAVVAKDAVTTKDSRGIVGDAGIVSYLGSALMETGALDGMSKDVSELRTSAAAAQSDLDKKLGLADTFRGRAFGDTITLANAVRTLQALSRLPSFDSELVGQVPAALSSQVTNATVLGGVMRGPKNQAALVAAVMPPAMAQPQATPAKRTA